MSVSRPARCIFCTFTKPSRIRIPSRRKLHSTPTVQKQEKPGNVNILAEARKSKGIQKADWEAHYSPRQVAAIEAARKIIDPKTLPPPRVDPWSVNYYDDFKEIDPVVDKPVRAPWKNLDENSRMKTQDELAEDTVKLMESVENLPKSEEEQNKFWEEWDRNLRLTVGKEEAEREPRSAMAPEIPKGYLSNTGSSKAGKSSTAAADKEITPELLTLMQMTGYSRPELAKLRVKTIITHRVVNQTRLGKISKMYFLTVAGNGDGLIGVGEGKADDSSSARLQSEYRAIRNMQPIMRYEGRTIFGDVTGKVSATELELYARPPGFGLRCQQYIWEICKCAGISDLAARVTRSRNPMNTVKATVQALLSQKDPEDVARGRGVKLVDVRKVYYAGGTS